MFTTTRIKMTALTHIPSSTVIYPSYYFLARKALICGAVISSNLPVAGFLYLLQLRHFIFQCAIG